MGSIARLAAPKIHIATSSDYWKIRAVKWGLFGRGAKLDDMDGKTAVNEALGHKCKHRHAFGDADSQLQQPKDLRCRRSEASSQSHPQLDVPGSRTHTHLSLSAWNVRKLKTTVAISTSAQLWPAAKLPVKQKRDHIFQHYRWYERQDVLKIGTTIRYHCFLRFYTQSFESCRPSIHTGRPWKQKQIHQRRNTEDVQNDTVTWTFWQYCKSAKFGSTDLQS